MTWTFNNKNTFLLFHGYSQDFFCTLKGYYCWFHVKVDAVLYSICCCKSSMIRINVSGLTFLLILTAEMMSPFNAQQKKIVDRSQSCVALF